MIRVSIIFATDDQIEAGRRLASKREDLIAAGVDPSLLAIPRHPGD